MGIADELSAAYGHNLLGLVAMAEGHYELARSNYEAAFQILHNVGDSLLTPLVLGNLGMIALFQGRFGDARSYYEKALRIEQETGDKYGTALALLGCAIIAGITGHKELAARLGGAAEQLREFLGTPLQPFEQAQHDQFFGPICTEFSESWAEGRTMGVEQAIMEALIILRSAQTDDNNAV